MKSEMIFVNGKLNIRVTNTITGESKVFGPYTTIAEAEKTLRDTDLLRKMFLEARNA